MVDTDHYSLIEGDAVPPDWFIAQLSRYGIGSNDHRSYLAEEIAALKAFHDGEINTEQAAHAITRPISTTSIPAAGTDSDEIVGLIKLWSLFTDALVEWPPNRTPDLVALLSAISKTPDQIHRGEASDDDEKPLTWLGLPYVVMVWTDAHWQDPGDIVKGCSDTSSRQRARNVYLKQQDCDAQLVAAGLLHWRRAFQYVIRTLEKDPESDKTIPESQAYKWLVPDFHFPAVRRWIQHNGQRLYRCLSEDELSRWEKRYIPKVARDFNCPLDRWAFWKQRLSEAVKSDLDDLTKNEARAAVQSMETIENASNGRC